VYRSAMSDAAFQRGCVAYVALIVALVVRSLAFPVDVVEEPPPPPPPCTWKGFGCSKGCVFRGKCVPRKAPSAAKPAISTARADELMKRRSVSNCLAAADVYEAAAEAAASPSEEAVLRLRTGEAVICALRIQTNGNIMVLEGTQDSPAFKQFWAKHGPRALANVRAAKPKLPDSFDLAAAEMDAFLYSNSAKGIVRQALTGAGNEYTKLASGLVSKYARSEGGVGHCYLGGFYAIAPWPLGNANRALTEMNAALAIEPKSRRNNYYVCMLQYQAGDKANAAKRCEAALRASCLGSEQDYCDFMTSQVQRILRLARS